ncbi:VOC family protein [Duganella sp. FT80W]|uniref:VOC family protein n=1 Tax=Duganella guangzhouensis TaxID=2666084 RepID=A0A6I2L5W6_9BURK|nr:VOC family protein [Duganella guangzhouensis]MRW93160.1 VOC family protein [Duganella guangzhouensis]
MKFNHLSFPSSDVPATAAFFVRHLDCTQEYLGPAAAMLKRGGFDIVIEAKDHTVTWPHNFHLGFELPSADAVRELYQRLRTQGVTMKTEVFHHERGTRFFCEAPGGLLFEMNTRADAEQRYRASFERQARADAVK